jgi:ATP-dependent Lon protease
VLEYLLGQHCATDNEEVLQSGLESVKRILAKHYVHRNQAELANSTRADNRSARGDHARDIEDPIARRVRGDL